VTKVSSGRRWGIRAAVGIIVVALLVTAGVAGSRLLASQAAASAGAGGATLAGWAPASAILYGEAHFDPTGDQHAKLAALVAHFPGWSDTTQFDTNLDKVWSEIVSKASRSEQSYATDIEPWFDGTVAIAVTRLPDLPKTAPLNTGTGSGDHGSGFAIVAVKDATAAKAWLTKTTTGMSGITTSTYNSVDLTSTAKGSAAVVGSVLLIGDTASVKSAIDQNGTGGLSADANFVAAQATVTSPNLATYYVNTKAYLDWASNLSTKSAGAIAGCVDSTSIPAWMAGSLTADDTAYIGSSASPHTSASPFTANASSALLAHLPSSTLFVADAHDVGKAVSSVVDRLNACPAAADGVKKVESIIDGLGGWPGVTGWMGEAAIAVDRNGSDPTGGLLIVPTDTDKADALMLQLKNWTALAGGAIKATDETNGGDTLTVLSGKYLDTPVAWTVTDKFVAIGVESWVKDVIDTTPANSLASDPTFTNALGHVAAEHTTLAYANVDALRQWAEPAMTAKEKTRYETDVKPYLSAFGSFIVTQSISGDLDRTTSALIVK
jgi:hypothetical protein